MAAMSMGTSFWPTAVVTTGTGPPSPPRPPRPPLPPPRPPPPPPEVAADVPPPFTISMGLLQGSQRRVALAETRVDDRDGVASDVPSLRCPLQLGETAARFRSLARHRIRMRGRGDADARAAHPLDGAIE